MFNGYMQEKLSVKDVTLSKAKLRFDTKYPMADSMIGPNSFMPFKEERDHLGRLIDSVSSVLL